jgi:hypothetical protein
MSTTSTRPQAGPPILTMAAMAGRITLLLLGEGRGSSSTSNAWQAVCADRRRAAERAETERVLTGVR